MEWIQIEMGMKMVDVGAICNIQVVKVRVKVL